MRHIRSTEWIPVLTVWTSIAFFGTFFGGSTLFVGATTLTTILIEVAAYFALSFLFVWFFVNNSSEQYTPSSSLWHRVLQCIAVIAAWFIIGSAKGLNLASDPNPTFQLGSSGAGWESTTSLGGIIGIMFGCAVVLALLFLYLREKRTF